MAKDYVGDVRVGMLLVFLFPYGLFNDAVSSPGCIGLSNDLMDYELKRMWKEVVVV
jgi:hypothetical protein